MPNIDPRKQVTLGLTNYLIANGFVPPNGQSIDDFYAYIEELAALSESQLTQDIVVQCILGFKQNGYFVEFGATNGVIYSNTLLLEKHFGWNGILSEPAKAWQPDLANNRNCIIENRCVWSESNKTLQFYEDKAPFISTLEQFINNDSLASHRKEAEIYEVNTISLNDLLDSHNAPTDIDYISIDTKGGEIDIISTFDFEKYNVSIFTINHNFIPKRTNIYDLMLSKGYVRVANKVSFIDDWYVKPALLGSLGNTDLPNFTDKNPPTFDVNNLIQELSY
jgi:hypothetical protein